MINGGENKENIALEQKSKNLFAIEITSTNPRTKKIILPKHYTFEKIKNEIIPKLLLDKKTLENIINAFIYDENVKIIEKETSDENFAIIKRERAKRGTIIREEEEEEKKKQLGRKRKDDNEVHDHNKHSKDNILQKIKTHNQKFLLIFINTFLEKNLDKDAIIIYVEKTKIKGKGKEIEEEIEIDKKIIKPLDYKAYVNKTSKSDNLNFLDMPIKTFLSQDISPKYSTFSRKANKIIIDEILRNNKNEVINFIFNLKLSDWLDVFLKKKEFSDFDGFKLNFTIDMKYRVEELLKNIYTSENDKSYFSRFILYIYNFRRILSIKQGRKSKKNDSNNSSNEISE